MTAGPPDSRLHPVPALCVTALLCIALACPAAAKPPPDKGPPAHAQVKGADKGNGAGKAVGRGHPKAKATPPGQAKAKATPPGHARAGERAAQKVKSPKNSGKARARGNPHTGSSAPAGPGNGAAPPTSSAAPPGATPGTEPAERRAAVRARAAAWRRAAAAARRASRAERRERAAARAGAGRGAAGTGTGSSAATASGGGAPAGSAETREQAGRPGADDGRPPFEPVTSNEDLPQPLRLAQDVVEVVPTPLRVLLAGLVALAVLLAAASGFTLLRNRRLARERRELLGEVGLLQAALLPDLPDGLASCRASVAYRPADGPGAGGDFYDVLNLAGGRTAILIGDVSGHGRAALARTALARYTLRAYIEAGLEPREALQVAGSVLAGKLEGDFVTALVAVHDAAAGTLTYATAGHPPPIVISSARFEPVLVGTPPPLGVGASTGQRETTVPFPPGAVACFYTDGLSEARTGGRQLEAKGLERLVRELGPEVTAKQVIDRVASSAHTIADDAAACVIVAEDGPAILRSRVERLDVSRAELRGPLLRGFLDACGVSAHGVRVAEREARTVAREMGAAVLEVRMAEPSQVEVRPPDLPLADGQLHAARV